MLSRTSAVRALLKGHAKPVTDLQFAGSDMLASGGQDGQLLVWQMRLDEGAGAIHEAQKLRASFVTAAGACSTCRGEACVLGGLAGWQGSPARQGAARSARARPSGQDPPGPLAPPPMYLPACPPCLPGSAGGDVFLSWHGPSQQLLAVGVGGRVLLVGVPADGMEQLEFELGADSTPGELWLGCSPAGLEGSE